MLVCKGNWKTYNPDCDVCISSQYPSVFIIISSACIGTHETSTHRDPTSRFQTTTLLPFLLPPTTCNFFPMLILPAPAPLVGARPRAPLAVMGLVVVVPLAVGVASVRSGEPWRPSTESASIGSGRKHRLWLDKRPSCSGLESSLLQVLALVG